jgi:glucan phosphoethanolaminetransferase (alkaline phosphatase superfamily)
MKKKFADALTKVACVSVVPRWQYNLSFVLKRFGPIVVMLLIVGIYAIVVYSFYKYKERRKTVVALGVAITILLAFFGWLLWARLQYVNNLPRNKYEAQMDAPQASSNSSGDTVVIGCDENLWGPWW